MLAVRRVVTLLLLLAIAGIAQATRSVAIVNLENNAIVGSGGKELTLGAVAQAIRVAGASQPYPWTASGDSPGTLQLTTVVRGKHTVVINVTFDTKTYSIRYASSINLNYKKKAKDGTEIIHPNYNVWVAQLRHAIDTELRKL